MQFQQIVAWTQGQTSCDQDFKVGALQLDSRRIKPGDGFIAWQGVREDGHHYIPDAAALGASFALVQRPIQASIPTLHVPDVLQATQAIARAWRAQCHHVTCLALTGSYGKTSTKNMLAHIMRAAQQPACVTQGNLNNHWGVPLTITACQSSDAYLIVEMGVNAPGDMDPLVHMAAPDVVAITCAGPCHLEGFKNVEGVARGKAAIYSRLTPEGIGLVNADDAFASYWRDCVLERGARCLTFGRTHEADLQAHNVVIDARGCPACDLVYQGAPVAQIQLPLLGEHHIHNALAAALMAHAAGISWPAIEQGLCQVMPEPGRLCLKPSQLGGWVIDDTYNASPEAFRAALRVLMAQDGEPWVIMGDMGELGDEAVTHHHQLGIDMKAMGVTRLITCGDLSAHASQGFGEGAVHVRHLDALMKVIQPHWHEAVTCLIKGSRSARMDVVVAELCDPRPWSE